MKKLFLIALMAFSMIANAQNLHWTYNSHTQYNMTITGEMYLDGVSLKTDTTAQYLEVGVFVGDECRGAFLPNLNPASYYQGYAYLMQVYSNVNGEEMSFKVFNHLTDEEMDVVCTSSFTFQSDANLGTLRNPYAITFFTPCEITLTANPEEGGTVEGAGVYNYGTNVVLTAVANEGYTFANWSKDNQVVSTEATYTFEVTSAGGYVATFTLNNYAITASAEPEVGGTVTGAGTYNHFAECTLTATANTGYHFVNWTKDGEEMSTDATYTFEVTGAGDYVANFAINNYAITATANPEEGGTVTGAGDYDHFAECTLTATANTGYHFVNWTKDGEEVSTEATYTFEVTGAGDYVATFALYSYEITTSVSPADCGTATGAGTYSYGETATLTATAATGYTFTNWKKNGEIVSTEASYSFMVTEGGEYVANFALNTYDVTATANPEEGGTVTGAGTYAHGETAVLTATAATGYTFINWTKNGQVVSTETVYTFEVTGAGDYVATFSLNSYAITATVNMTVGGTVSGAGTYNHFAECTLTATPNTGYHFVNWTKDGEMVSTEAVFTFEVTGPGDYVANFAINGYEVTVTANPANGGTVTGAGTYTHGTSITLTAIPNTGYTFGNWTKDGEVVSSSANYTFAVTDNGDYVANFIINQYTIVAVSNPEDAGTLYGTGSYNHGATCTLVAVALPGHSFINWTKDGEVVSTHASYSFTVTNYGVYVANFSTANYNISASANPSYAGTVSGAGSYTYGTSVTLTATANTGYYFENWTKNGEVMSTEADYTFEVTGSGSYVANFGTNEYTVTTVASPSTGGTVSGGGTYSFGQSCTVTAEPAEHYTFVNWTNGAGQAVSTNATYQFTVNGDVTMTAHFTLTSYNITATADPAAGGTVSGAGAYEYGASCTLVASAAEGYTFVNWTSNGVTVSSNASYTFTVTGAQAFVAHFSLNTYDIAAEANPANAGTVTGAGTYGYGTNCTLTATAAAGYRFVNWTCEGEVVSTDAAYTFAVTGAATFVANFETVTTYEIVVIADPEDMGTVSGGGIYEEGETVTVTAEPLAGCYFLNWTENGEVVSEDLEYSFVVTADRELVAHFDVDGIGEITDVAFEIYPNPVKENLYIAGETLITRCKIYNVAGEMVYVQNGNSTNMTVNVENLIDGMYIIHIEYGNTMQVKRFVKR